MSTTRSPHATVLFPGLALVALIAAPGRAYAQRRDALHSESITAQSLSDVRPVPALTLQQPRRRSSGGRIALQFLAASAGAAGGGLGGYFVLHDVSEQRVEGDEGYTRSGNVGYLLGSWIGATIGAHAVGTSMGAKAPVWATALGALVGTTPLMALGIDEPWLPLYGLLLGWIPQGALATGGFNMAERK